MRTVSRPGMSESTCGSSLLGKHATKPSVAAFASSDCNHCGTTAVVRVHIRNLVWKIGQAREVWEVWEVREVRELW